MTCPSSEELVAAAARGASQETRERVADHLVACSRCAEEFKVLQEIGPWATDHAHLVGGSAHTTFATAGPARASRASQHSRESWARRFGSPWAYATAAVLVLAVAALQVQVQRLQRENRTLVEHARSTETAPPIPAPSPSPSAALEARVAEQQRTIAGLEQRLRTADAPDLNAPIIDLEPADARRSAGGAPETPAVPAGARSIVFVLNTTHPAAGATYDVELVGAGNRVLWTGSGLKQSADRTLTLVVPRALLAGATRLRLYSDADSRRTLVEEYAVPIVRP
jgi:uncharacterized coiled-coil protein SlyX